MPKYKNISGGRLDLSIPGLGQQSAEDGEIVDIPAFQLDGVSPLVVPPNRWEPVPDKPAAKTSANADDTSGKAAV
jgi:hypothetical protein